MASRQNGVRDQASIQETSKPQDLIVCTDGSVTKAQSMWGFSVKQGATTIHEDSAAYTVSTCSLTMKVGAVTHALRWIAPRGDSQTTHAIILTDSELLHTYQPSRTLRSSSEKLLKVPKTNLKSAGNLSTFKQLKSGTLFLQTSAALHLLF